MSVESVRDKIMESALDLFSEKGYDGTSIDEIALACGMKAPNIYKYFKGKKEIFDVLNQTAAESYKSNMRMTTAILVNLHTKEELKDFSMRQLRYTIFDERVRKFRKLFTIEQYRNDFMRAQASDYALNNIKNQYILIFSNMMENGTLPKCDPEMLAMEYCAPVTLWLQLCDREPKYCDEIIEKAEKYIDFFIEKTFPTA